ncbi:MAG: phosphohydrolase [Desulfobacterales bacterium]|nr:phosphohydrolase [Desulfobacterales bacterium]
MDILEIIREYYVDNRTLYDIFMKHSISVRDKAIEIAEKVPHLSPDLQFVEEASMLHDIGIFLTDAPSINCHGKSPYVCHGFKGFEILVEKGYKKHGLVCERHTLMGISMETIVDRRLPLPKRDMIPLTVEEKIICYADKFFSKSGDGREKSFDIVIKELGKYGEDQVKRFFEIKNLLKD